MAHIRVQWLLILYVLLCQLIEVKGQTNLALHKLATQSSTYERATADRATDGLTYTVFEQGTCTHTSAYTEDRSPWWQVDLQDVYCIKKVKVLNRETFGERLRNFQVSVISEDSSKTSICGTYSGIPPAGAWTTMTCGSHVFGRFVRIQIFNIGESDGLTLCEVNVEGQKSQVLVKQQPLCGASTLYKHPSQRLETALIKEILSNTSTTCATSCYMTPLCIAFNYNNNLSVCQLLKSGDPCEEAVTDPGWDFYVYGSN